MARPTRQFRERDGREREPRWEETFVVELLPVAGKDSGAGNDNVNLVGPILHRLADFFMVNSLHDGMNLVAKEFVCSRFDDGGALILSRFTGAYRELGDALGVNPYAVDETAEAIYQALTMPLPERQRRMHRMRRQLQDSTIFDWLESILAKAGEIMHQQSESIAHA